MRFRQFLIRNYEIGPLLDVFLVTAVATILIIRTQLWLTNYPQLGGGNLHIAHLLWGGMFMLIAIIMMLAFITRWTRHAAALLAGVGFGFFIDELGKFITSDNNYFFQPTAALIYVTFILLYLGTRRLLRERPLSQREYLMNSIDLIKEAAIHDLDQREKRHAERFLQRADAGDPLVKPLRALLRRVDAIPSPLPSRLQRWAKEVQRRYFGLVKKPWFGKALTVFFVVLAVGSLVQIATLVFSAGSSVANLDPTAFFNRVSDESGKLGFTQWASVASSVAAGLVMIAGVWRLRSDRLAAYHLFERALLISIFITQVFAFVESQFTAVFGLLFNILILIALRYMIKQEVRAKAS